MRARSKKRAAQEREYSRKRRLFLEARPQCEFPDCTARADQVHHRRGRVGALLLDETFWTAICPPHHMFVTEHPAVAYDLGISERRVG